MSDATPHTLAAAPARFLTPTRPARRRRRARRSPDRTAHRLTREALAARAQLLPPDAAALLHAHVECGMSVEEIARLKELPERLVRHRIKRLKERLADPCFVLAARFRDRLPAELAPLAAAHWLDDMPLRELARRQGQTLHRVRQDLAKARSILLLLLSSEHEVSPELATAALDARRSAGV